MTKPIDFVMGHCGWDALTLLPDGQIVPEDELAAALRILDSPMQGGLEVGFLGKADEPNTVSMRMVSSTQRDWIPMCGGMTQVVGKALVESFLRDRLAIDVTSPETRVRLITPSGEIPIDIGIDQGRVRRVVTRMRHYVGFLAKLGIEEMTIADVPVIRVGEFAVIDIAALQTAFPGLDFTDRRFGPALDAVNGVLAEFGRHTGQAGVNGMLYDDAAEDGGDFRVYPRFVSDDMAAARCPWEFQCGTGSVAVALGLHRRGRIGADTGQVVFEWGNRHVTPDPYGVRRSIIEITTAGGEVTDAAFSHSHVEILAQGALSLPEFATPS